MQAARLAGTTSLLKYQATRAAALVADGAVQIFGGRGITKTGMGKNAERFNVAYKVTTDHLYRSVPVHIGQCACV